MKTLREAVVLAAHGTVDSLEDLPEFLTNIRHGHAPPPELLQETRRRYECIGGGSPLNAIHRTLAERLEAKIGLPVRLANRLFHPYPAETLAELVALGASRIYVVPLAQYSASIYGQAVVRAAEEAFPSALEVVCAPNWGNRPELVDAFATTIVEALDAFDREPVHEPRGVIFSAHSLPISVVRAGDPYEVEYRSSAASILSEVERRRPEVRIDHAVAFQSQGLSIGAGSRSVTWLGPDLRTTLEALRARDVRNVVFAPIGFLADHVEILYDLDVEAKGYCDALGMSFRRASLLNAEEPLVDLLEILVRSLRFDRTTENASS